MTVIFFFFSFQPPRPPSGGVGAWCPAGVPPWAGQLLQPLVEPPDLVLQLPTPPLGWHGRLEPLQRRQHRLRRGRAGGGRGAGRAGRREGGVLGHCLGHAHQAQATAAAAALLRVGGGGQGALWENLVGRAGEQVGGSDAPQPKQRRSQKLPCQRTAPKNRPENITLGIFGQKCVKIAKKLAHSARRTKI